MRSSSTKLQSGFGSAAFFALLTTIIGAQLALADPRVVVVGPNQGPQDVPQDQHVIGGKTVLVNNEPITIVHTEPMPPKAKFCICVKVPTGAPPPNDMTCVYFPFPPDHDEDGAHIEHVLQVNNSPGGDSYTVYEHVSRNGVGGDGPKTNFPPGSILIPDPPQPVGLKFFVNRYPADPATESAVLAALGQPDNPWPEVWFVVSGDFYFFINGNPAGSPVHFSPSHKYGDLNCDNVVDLQDVSHFALALLDTSAYQSTDPNCDYFYADMNGDGMINGKDVASFVTTVLGA